MPKCSSRQPRGKFSLSRMPRPGPSHMFPKHGAPCSPARGPSAASAKPTARRRAATADSVSEATCKWRQVTPLPCRPVVHHPPPPLSCSVLPMEYEMRRLQQRIRAGKSEEPVCIEPPQGLDEANSRRPDTCLRLERSLHGLCKSSRPWLEHSKAAPGRAPSTSRALTPVSSVGTRRCWCVTLMILPLQLHAHSPSPLSAQLRPNILHCQCP
jgi:hypothetical protein